MKKHLMKHGARPVKIEFEPLPDNPNVMKITRTSDTAGKCNTMDLPVTEDQLRNWLGGNLIQNVMPHLDKEQREFLISGTTPEEWDSIFKEEPPTK